MTTRVTADTNVFYYLASGALDIKDVVNSGEELHATPVNVLEIVAGVSLTQWEQRRDAAKAIVKYATHMAVDPEAHLAGIIERTTPKANPLWMQGAKTLAKAKSASELRTGVKDFRAKVVARVNVPFASAAKTRHYRCKGQSNCHKRRAANMEPGPGVPLEMS